jgi:hypothetical protein
MLVTCICDASTGFRYGFAGAGRGPTEPVGKQFVTSGRFMLLAATGVAVFAGGFLIGHGLGGNSEEVQVYHSLSTVPSSDSSVKVPTFSAATKLPTLEVSTATTVEPTTEAGVESEGGTEFPVQPTTEVTKEPVKQPIKQPTTQAPVTTPSQQGEQEVTSAEEESAE